MTPESNRGAREITASSRERRGARQNPAYGLPPNRNPRRTAGVSVALRLEFRGAEVHGTIERHGKSYCCHSREASRAFPSATSASSLSLSRSEINSDKHLEEPIGVPATARPGRQVSRTQGTRLAFSVSAFSIISRRSPFAFP